MALATLTNYMTPTGREEPWRFTPLNRLAGLHDAQVGLRDRISLEPLDIPTGVSVTIEDAEAFPPLSETADQIVIRVREGASKLLLLTIESNAEISEPIFLKRNVLDLSPEVSRVQINAGANSHAIIVIENSGEGVFAEELWRRLWAGSTGVCWLVDDPRHGFAVDRPARGDADQMRVEPV